MANLCRLRVANISLMILVAVLCHFLLRIFDLKHETKDAMHYCLRSIDVFDSCIWFMLRISGIGISKM